MKIGVIGAGPIGSLLSSHLIRAGHEVTLCEISQSRRDALLQKGIRVSGVREFRVPVVSVISSVDEFAESLPEVLFVAVKAQVLPLVSSSIQEFAKPEMTVVSWQNGIDTERVLADHLRPQQVVRAVINHGVSFTPAGDVAIAFDHPPHFVQEVVPEGAEKARALAEVLSKCGLETERSDHLETAVWKKGVLNAALNALCALTGMNMQDAWEDSYASWLAKQILREGVQVARANEVFLGHQFYRWALDYLRDAGSHKPSMLVDREAGRRTEIDFINGKIVEYGEIAGISTPFNRTMLALVKAVEKKQTTPR
jgi:2-dehydropantoate 2-reductase